MSEGVSFTSISIPSAVLSGDGGEGLSPDVGAGLSADCNVGLLQSVVDTVAGGLCPLDTSEPCGCEPDGFCPSIETNVLPFREDTRSSRSCGTDADTVCIHLLRILGGIFSSSTSIKSGVGPSPSPSTSTSASTSVSSIARPLPFLSRVLVEFEVRDALEVEIVGRQFDGPPLGPKFEDPAGVLKLGGHMLGPALDNTPLDPALKPPDRKSVV